jgi:hypothetical protein
MNSKIISMLILAGMALAACASPADPAVTPTAFGLASPTFFPVETSALSTQPPLSLTPLPTTAGSTNLCTDPQATALIDSLKTAVLNSDGPLLASLVSPASGLDVAFFHSGTVVNYRPDQAKFLFETTYEVDWGVEPGSGARKTGSFHDVVVPALVKMFNQPYTLHCNELKYGGATYPVNFPYDKGYYSIYFGGTEANGSLDWQTWVAGIEYVDGRPYLYALMQFFWEP